MNDARSEPEPSTESFDVVAIGSALVDILTDASVEDLRRFDMVKGSMTLVDLARAATLYDAMGPAVEVSGGSAANTAVGVAALGGRVGYLGKVAADELGEVFLHDITAAGVELGRTGRVEPSTDPADDRATGRCLVLVTDDGERTMATHLGVASTLGPEDLDEEFVARAQVVYLEGYLWDLGPAKAAMRRAMQVAHDTDSLVALSLSDPFCVQRHQREFLELLHGDVDVLFANEDETTLLFGTPTFDDAVVAVEETGILAALDQGAGRFGGRRRVRAGTGGGGPCRARRRHHRCRGSLRGRLPLRPHPRQGSRDLRPSGWAVRSRGDLPYRGATPGRPARAGFERRTAVSPTERVWESVALVADVVCFGREVGEVEIAQAHQH